MDDNYKNALQLQKLKQGLDQVTKQFRINRYPTQYKNYNLFANTTGREMMQKLWAEYLKWSEP